MIAFLIGVSIGTIAGYIAACFAHAASDEDDAMQRAMRNSANGTEDTK